MKCYVLSRMGKNEKLHFRESQVSSSGIKVQKCLPYLCVDVINKTTYANWTIQISLFSFSPFWVCFDSIIYVWLLLVFCRKSGGCIARILTWNTCSLRTCNSHLCIHTCWQGAVIDCTKSSAQCFRTARQWRGPEAKTVLQTALEAHGF